MLDKARVPGERNMTGGVLYGDFPGQWGLISLVPDFESTGPLERRIVSHEVVVLGEPDFEKGRSRYYRLSKASLAARLGLFQMEFETGHDYTVLRRPFDRWFANLAVQAGAMLSTETTAEGLLKEGERVVGVRTPGEELRAKLVIDASGVTSNLVAEAGLRERLTPRQLYHGIKRVYGLDPSTIERRFRVRPGEGRAVFFLGGFMHGVGGGAFIYTNRDTLSVGLVVSLDSLIRRTTERFDQVGKLLDILDEFEDHPMVAELLDGAQPLEYSAHNIPKGFKSILKRPYADGFLVTGDALGSFVKIGPMIDDAEGGHFGDDGGVGVPLCQLVRLFRREEPVPVPGAPGPNLRRRQQVREGQLRLREPVRLPRPPQADLLYASAVKRLHLRALEADRAPPRFNRESPGRDGAPRLRRGRDPLAHRRRRRARFEVALQAVGPRLPHQLFHHLHFEGGLRLIQGPLRA
jgi:flavin-dependent dehydrogenase